MPFIKKQEVPNYYVYNEECLNITKCTLSCLDNLGNGNNGIAQVYYEGGADIASSQALSILDTPSTTSQITYQIYVRANSSNAFINIFGSTSSITAFEIAG